MLSWMLYAIVVSLLIGLAALALERSAQARRKPARLLWGMGIVASLVIPFTAPSVSVQIPQMTSVAAPATSGNLPAPPQTTAIERSRSAWSIAGIGQLPAYVPASRGVDTLLVAAWRTASIALALVIIASATHLSWRRRRWGRGHMAGTAVYLSEDSGPAVVGFFCPRIVVPRWLTHCSPGEQELVIAHERSHLDAHDAQLLTIAVCLLVCMPWNLVLWWQLRRLRLAIEIDCDARVLSLGHPVARYGETLIAVGERQSAGHAMGMATFGSKSFLERRIHTMLRTKTRYARVWATALACLGAGLAVSAAEVAPPQVGVADTTSYQETAVDAQLLDGYVGSYRYGNAVLLISRDGQQLAASLAGQPGRPIYPRSNTEFFSRRNDSQITFMTDMQGKAESLIVRRGSGDVKMIRIDATTAQQIASATAEKQKTQSSNPRRVAALTRLINGIEAGNLNYDDMRAWLATAINYRLAKLQSVIAPLGAVQSVQYLGVDNQGSDVYTVEQEHGVSHWRVALDAAGLMSGAMVTPGLHSVLLDEDEAVSGLVLP
jgi:beta-lactamase regulating signal transducer with metallopeptidase domain